MFGLRFGVFGLRFGVWGWRVRAFLQVSVGRRHLWEECMELRQHCEESGGSVCTGFRIQGPGFMIQGSRFTIQGSGCNFRG